MPKRFIMLIILLLTGSAAQGMERFEIVTTQELNQMLADRKAGKSDFVLVNALDELIFRHCAIPGSINVPYPRVTETIHRLGTEKHKLVVTY